MKLVTWNINSIRARLDQLLDWVEAEDPDVLCLQETKISDQEFPEDEIAELGYDIAYYGQPNYNGVAIATKEAAKRIQLGLPDDTPDSDKRLVALEVDGVRVISAYVPNGQAVGSEAYQFKLDWLERLRRFVETSSDAKAPLVLCGDFNICPADLDCWDPVRWAGRIFTTDAERSALQALLDFGLTDVFRHNHPDVQSFTWWDYRDAAFERNEGLRIDLMLVSAPVLDRFSEVRVDLEPRAQIKSSDHAPVILELSDP